MAAVKSLIEEKMVPASEFSDLQGEDGYREPQTHFIDNIVYDGKKPNEYINKFTIGLKAKDKI